MILLSRYKMDSKAAFQHMENIIDRLEKYYLKILTNTNSQAEIKKIRSAMSINVVDSRHKLNKLRCFEAGIIESVRCTHKDADGAVCKLNTWTINRPAYCKNHQLKESSDYEDDEQNNEDEEIDEDEQNSKEQKDEENIQSNKQEDIKRKSPEKVNDDEQKNEEILKTPSEDTKNKKTTEISTDLTVKKDQKTDENSNSSEYSEKNDNLENEAGPFKKRRLVPPENSKHENQKNIQSRLAAFLRRQI